MSELRHPSSVRVSSAFELYAGRPCAPAHAPIMTAVLKDTTDLFRAALLVRPDKKQRLDVADMLVARQIRQL